MYHSIVNAKWILFCISVLLCKNERLYVKYWMIMIRRPTKITFTRNLTKDLGSKLGDDVLSRTSELERLEVSWILDSKIFKKICWQTRRGKRRWKRQMIPPTRKSRWIKKTSQTSLWRKIMKVLKAVHVRYRLNYVFVLNWNTAREI